MPGAEGRRSPRILLRISVLIEDPPPAAPARTAVVNRQGAMILSPRPYPQGTRLRLRNLESGDRAGFQVVWQGGEDDNGFHKLGIELLEERPGFWGAEYDEAVAAEELA